MKVEIMAELLNLVVLHCTDVLDKVACECTDMQFYAKLWAPMTIGLLRFFILFESKQTASGT